MFEGSRKDNFLSILETSLDILFNLETVIVFYSVIFI